MSGDEEIMQQNKAAEPMLASTWKAPDAQQEDEFNAYNDGVNKGLEMGTSLR